MALKRMGSERLSQDMEIKYMVLISKRPLGVGANLELIEMLLKYHCMM